MNAAEEAIAEELSPSEELFTTVVFEQGNDTSWFCVYSSCQSWYNEFLHQSKSDKFKSQSDEFNSQREKFICQQDEVDCQKDKFNCQSL